MRGGEVFKKVLPHVLYIDRGPPEEGHSAYSFKVSVMSNRRI